MRGLSLPRAATIVIKSRPVIITALNKNFIMKKIIFFLLIFVPVQDILTQLSNFDSVKTVVSSASYDYRNPVFNTAMGDIFSYTWLAYERYKPNGASDIIVRKVTYDSYEAETVLTAAVNDSNINPCVFDNFVFWESNKDGSRNIYYSVFSGGVWSAPVVLPGSTAANETQPFFSYNYLGPVQYSYHVLVFKRGNDIFLKKYIDATNTWDSEELNVTDSISEDCSQPIIAYEGSQDFTIAFNKKMSEVLCKINLRRFHIFNNGLISWLNKYEVNPVVWTQKMQLSRGSSFFYQRVTFDTNTSVRRVMAINSSSSPSLLPLSTPVSGSNFSGKGVLMGILVTDAAPYFSAFGCISKRSDSTFIVVCKQYDATGSTVNLKRKYIGSSVDTRLDLSSALISPNRYKIRAVWERVINGKVALEESYMTDILGSVTFTGNAVDYSLSQNYPNPFNPSTRINYELRNTNYVSLKVFNSTGKEVATLINEKQNAGSYAVDFNSTEFNLPSGIYFYTLNAGEFKETRKMILIK
jgi:hypothetical protein